MARDPRPKQPSDDSESSWNAYDRELDAWEERESRRRLGLRNTALQAGAAALSVGGYVADPGQLPNTGQLDDAHASQTERYRDSIEDESHKQGTDTSQRG